MSSSSNDSPPRCFNRVENEEPNFSPCSPSGGEPAHCCDLDSYRCATNGLCVVIERFSSDERYLYNTGGCTDSSWEAETCVDYCRQFNHSGVNTCGTRGFCCRGEDNCDCDESSERFFTLDPVRLVAETTLSSLSSASRPSSTIDPSSTQSSSPPSTTANSTALADTTAVTSSGSDSSNGNDNSLAIGLGAGLGVGIPLAALLIGLLFFCRGRRAWRSSPTPSEKTPFSDRPYHSSQDQSAPSPYSSTFGGSSTSKPGSSGGGWARAYSEGKDENGRGMVELGDGMGRVEMDGRPMNGTAAVELPAGR